MITLLYNWIYSWVYKRVNHWGVATGLSIFFIISKLSFIFSSIGLILYAYSYAFLYGYYFSGEKTGYLAILDIISNIVPINTYSLLLITVVLFLIILFFISIPKLIKISKLFIVAGIIFFLVLHACISIFFMSGEDLGRMFFQSLFLWLLPLLVFTVFFWWYRSTKKLYLSLLGVIYGLVLLIVFTPLLKSYIEYVLMLSPFIIILISFLITFIKIDFKRSRISSYLLHTPLIFIILAIVNKYTHVLSFDNELFNVLIVAGTSFFLCIIIDSVIRLVIFRIEKKRIEKKEQIGKVEQTSSNKLKIEENKNKTILVSLYTVVGSVSILFLLTFVPNISLMTGQYIREVTNDGESKVNISSSSMEIKGEVIAIKEGIYYISDENWRLVIIKEDNIIIYNK